MLLYMFWLATAAFFTANIKVISAWNSSCTLRAIENQPRFYEELVHGSYMRRPCAPGTLFSPMHCQCAIHDTGITDTDVQCKLKAVVNEPAFYEYLANGVYIRSRCIPGFLFNQNDCACSIKELEITNPVTHKPLDLILVIDGSHSVMKEDFKTILNDVKEFIREVIVRNEDSRVGLVLYDNKIIPLTNDVKNIDILIDRLQQPGGANKMDDDLTHLIKIFKDKGRNSAHVGIIIMNSEPANSAAAQSVAKEARDMNTTLFVIGVGKPLRDEQLLELSSGPKFARFIPNFSFLGDELGRLINEEIPNSLEN